MGDFQAGVLINRVLIKRNNVYVSNNLVLIWDWPFQFSWSQIGATFASSEIEGFTVQNQQDWAWKADLLQET